MKKALMLLIGIVFMTIPAYALEVQNTHTFRYDIRGDDGGDLYLNQLTLKGKIPLERINRDLTLGAFVEGQYTFDSEDFDMSKVGALAGLKPVKWLSVTEDIYYANSSEDYMWRTKLVASFPFKVFELNPSFQLFEEHRFNLDEAEGARNDVGVGISVPLNDIITCYIGWRHTDRIHRFDTDYIETKLDFSF